MQTLDIPFATKFLAPKRRSSAVRRAGLHQHLQANLERKVQVLWAPAGYGKTTLLSESLADAVNLTCWYLLTQDDKDPREFAQSCVNAVRVCLPDFGHTVPRLGACDSTETGTPTSGCLSRPSSTKCLASWSSSSMTFTTSRTIPRSEKP